MVARLSGCGPLAEPVAEDVGHDGEEPGLFVRAGLETISVAVGSQIRFLHQVLGVLRLPREAQRAPIERVDVPLKKRKAAIHANASLVHSIPAYSVRSAIRQPGGALSPGPPGPGGPPGRWPRPRPRPRRRRRRFGSCGARVSPFAGEGRFPDSPSPLAGGGRPPGSPPPPPGAGRGGGEGPSRGRGGAPGGAGSG